MSPKIRISAVVVLSLFAASVVTLQVFAARPLDANLDGLTARQAVALANKWSDEKQPVKTFINPREIVFDFGNGKTRRIPLPADEMMIAIAPYVQKTHPCAVHYISSCQGELSETDLSVKAVDEAGKVLFDQRLKTLKNGFFEIWLPRGKTFQVTVTGMTRSATETIPTMDNSRTCITTMRLK